MKGSNKFHINGYWNSIFEEYDLLLECRHNVHSYTSNMMRTHQFHELNEALVRLKQCKNNNPAFKMCC
jgi:hypothetical protein